MALEASVHCVKPVWTSAAVSKETKSTKKLKDQSETKGPKDPKGPRAKRAKEGEAKWHQESHQLGFRHCKWLLFAIFPREASSKQCKQASKEWQKGTERNVERTFERAPA